MWTYSQSTGELKHDDTTIGFGFSGYQDGINIPAMQDLPDLGPIPRGLWQLLHPPVDHPHLGPYALQLTADPNTNTFHRSGFWIHGRSIKLPFNSSHGCIALTRPLREQLWNSNDHLLTVTP